MKFIAAHHKRDFDGVDQTVGLDPLGQIWLMAGMTDATGTGKAYGQFAPRDAIRYAYQVISLALQGIRIQENNETLTGTETNDNAKP